MHCAPNLEVGGATWVPAAGAFTAFTQACKPHQPRTEGGTGAALDFRGQPGSVSCFTRGAVRSCWGARGPPSRQGSRCRRPGAGQALPGSRRPGRGVGVTSGARGPKGGVVGGAEKAGRVEEHPVPSAAGAAARASVRPERAAQQHSPRVAQRGGDAGIARISVHGSCAPAPSAASSSSPGRPGGSGAQVGCAMSGAG